VPACAALRISLPDSHCVVTDNYGPSGAASGLITLDLKNHRLITTVNPKCADVPPKDEGVFFRRRIEFEPLVARDE